MGNSRSLPLALLLAATCAVAAAQDRIAVRPAPRPDQTIHVTTTQELLIAMEGGAPDGPPGVQVMSKTTLAYAQANGQFDDQGHMESQLTIDRLETEQTINGTAKKVPTSELVGHSLTAVFDRAGRLIDVKVPKDVEQASSMLKQLLAGAYSASNFLSDATMAIGDTTDVAADIPLRLSGAGEKTPYQTRTVLTLRAVEKRGADRIARLEERVESAGGREAVTVTGTGTIDVNLDRGFVSASAIEWTFAGTVPGTAGAAPAQGRGTFKITLTANE